MNEETYRLGPTGDGSTVIKFNKHELLRLLLSLYMSIDRSKDEEQNSDFRALIDKLDDELRCMT